MEIKEKIEYMEAMVTLGLTCHAVADWEPKRKWLHNPVKVRTEPKIGRNQSCPCGSGTKHKKCCAIKTYQK